MKPAQIAIATGFLIILLAVGVGARTLRRRTVSPAELERRRRLHIHQTGKMGDGEILDVESAQASITYSYSVAGVGYTAMQDVAALTAMLPPDIMTMVGPIGIKFDPHNPANSIVLCEDWSGLRHRGARAGASRLQG